MEKVFHLIFQPKYVNGEFSPRLVYGIFSKAEDGKYEKLEEKEEVMQGFAQNMRDVGLESLFSAISIVSKSRIVNYINENSSLNELLKDRKKMLEMTPEQKKSIAKIFSDLVFPIYSDSFENVSKVEHESPVADALPLLDVRIVDGIISPTGSTDIFNEVKDDIDDKFMVPKVLIMENRRRLNLILKSLSTKPLDAETLSNINCLVRIPAFENDYSESVAIKLEPPMSVIIENAIAESKDKDIISWVVDNSICKNWAYMCAILSGVKGSLDKSDEQANFVKYEVAGASINENIIKAVLAQMIDSKLLVSGNFRDIINIVIEELKPENSGSKTPFPIMDLVKIAKSNILNSEDRAILVRLLENNMAKNFPAQASLVFKDPSWPKNQRRVLKSIGIAYGKEDLDKYELATGKRLKYKYTHVREINKIDGGFYDLNGLEIIESDKPMYEDIQKIHKDFVAWSGHPGY